MEADFEIITFKTILVTPDHTGRLKGRVGEKLPGRMTGGEKGRCVQLRIEFVLEKCL